jgi:hypothetical protein
MFFILLMTALGTIFYQEVSANEKELTSAIDTANGELNNMQETLTNTELAVLEKDSVVKDLEQQLHLLNTWNKFLMTQA